MRRVAPTVRFRLAGRKCCSKSAKLVMGFCMRPGIRMFPRQSSRITRSPDAGSKRSNTCWSRERQGEFSRQKLLTSWGSVSFSLLESQKLYCLLLQPPSFRSYLLIRAELHVRTGSYFDPLFLPSPTRVGPHLLLVYL